MSKGCWAQLYWPLQCTPNPGWEYPLVIIMILGACSCGEPARFGDIVKADAPSLTQRANSTPRQYVTPLLRVRRFIAKRLAPIRHLKDASPGGLNAKKLAHLDFGIKMCVNDTMVFVLSTKYFAFLAASEAKHPSPYTWSAHSASKRTGLFSKETARQRLLHVLVAALYNLPWPSATLPRLVTSGHIISLSLGLVCDFHCLLSTK